MCKRCSYVPFISSVRSTPFHSVCTKGIEFYYAFIKSPLVRRQRQWIWYQHLSLLPHSSVHCKSPLITHLGGTVTLYSDLIYSVREESCLPHLPPRPDYTLSFVQERNEENKRGKLAFATYLRATCRGLWCFSADFSILRGTRVVWCGRHAFLHSDRFHGEPVVRRDGRLYLHHTGGNRGMQWENAAGQSSVQWLWEGGGKWCYIRVITGCIHFCVLMNGENQTAHKHWARVFARWFKRGRSCDREAIWGSFWKQEKRLRKYLLLWAWIRL